MTRAYGAFGAAVVLALAWIHFTGWSPSPITEAKTGPTTVRDNPGSYRPAYGARPYTGAK